MKRQGAALAVQLWVHRRVCVWRDDSEQTAILGSSKCRKDKDTVNVTDNQEANDREPPLQRQQPFRQQLYSPFFVFWVAKQPGCN